MPALGGATQSSYFLPRKYLILCSTFEPQPLHPNVVVSILDDLYPLSPIRIRSSTGFLMAPFPTLSISSIWRRLSTSLRSLAVQTSLAFAFTFRRVLPLCLPSLVLPHKLWVSCSKYLPLTERECQVHGDARLLFPRIDDPSSHDRWSEEQVRGFSLV